MRSGSTLRYVSHSPELIVFLMVGGERRQTLTH